MVSFSFTDLIIIVAFFIVLFLFGFLSSGSKTKNSEEYLLNGRSLGLGLFILTNVATWYGGILGVGEFTYRYGLLSWLTQGFPYYIFALIFGLFFASKIRETSLFTIPDKLESVYGRRVGMISAVIVFILVSPAPYLLMLSQLIGLVFGTGNLISALIALFISVAYLFKGGYKSDVWTDAFQFFIMFAGFITIVIILFINYGTLDFLSSNLPPSHLKLTGNASPLYILVWFFIALWTITDPGFHQRSYAAKSPGIAKKGIIYSILFWILFDFLTTTTGLFARALLPDLSNPIYAFPLLAEKILGPGLKGIFYAALLATIISTLNSYLFLSATTLGRDFLYKIKPDDEKLSKYTKIGLALSSLIGIGLALTISSIIELWYLIGSICIPGMILLIVGAYYPRWRVNKTFALIELISGVALSSTWYIVRQSLNRDSLLYSIEPMLLGLAFVFVMHLLGIANNKEGREKPVQ